MAPQQSTGTNGGARVVAPCSGCIEVIYEGVVDGDVVRDSVERVRRMAQRQSLRYLLVDGTGITSYDSTVRDEGRALLQVLRDSNGDEVVMVLSSAVHRLLGATVAMMVRIPIKIFQTRAEALGYVENRLAGFS